MRILYGVQGTGNGHITRARALLPALKKYGIQADFLFSGRPNSHYFDMENFGRYQLYNGFTLQTRSGRINWPQTLAKLSPARFWHDINALDLSPYQCVLTDFEPVSAWAARRQGIPSVGLAHQYALLHHLPGTPKLPWLRQFIRHFAPAQQQLGLHWQTFGHPILPPLIPANPHPIADEGFLLIYLPFEQPANLIRWLQNIPHIECRLYAPVKTADRQHNVHIRPLSREAFPQDLARCHGVISNSGFGLCSEAMMLGKKILTKPLPAQIEQQSNAVILQNMQRATVFCHFQPDLLHNWLQQAVPAPLHFADTADAVARWLAGGRIQSPQQLADRLWQTPANHPSP